MSVTMPHTATQYLANALTFARGSAADVQRVGVYYADDPLYVPMVSDFIDARLVLPGDPLAEGNFTDILALVGDRQAADVSLPAGDYQVWLLVVTADEDIMLRMDTLEML